MRKNNEDWVKKCMEIRVECKRPRNTWLENVEVAMTEVEINREDIHDRKKWRHNVMKRKYNPI